MTDSLRPIGEVATEIVADVKFRALVRTLHNKRPQLRVVPDDKGAA